MSEETLSPAALYADMTNHIVRTSDDVLACHFGLWGSDTQTDAEALLRTNQVLVKHCELGPGRTVLDAGCGLGGTSIHLAETHGVEVKGLTNCEPHLEKATEYARQREVDHLVEFVYGDFMNLTFPDCYFDAVINLESFCYASSIQTYLQGIYRVLKPGGRWQAIEGFLNRDNLSGDQEETHLSVQQGFQMPPLHNWCEVLLVLEGIGYDNLKEEELDSEAAVAMEKIRMQWMLFQMFTPPPREKDQSYHDFMRAALDFYHGMQEGIFTYRLVSGRKPS